MQVRVLGELEVSLGSGEAPELGGAKPRTLVGVLVAAEGRPVHVGRLIGQMWGESPPERAEASLQTYVARLRKAFGGKTGDAGRLRTHAGGYSLAVVADEVDARRFADSVRRARAQVASDPLGAERGLAAALGEWRGDPYSGLTGPILEAEAARLEELRLLAVEALWDARLRTNGHPEAVAELEQLVHRHPLHEQLWALLARAQYRGARQGEALDTLRRAREHLVEELGIDPGPALRDLEAAMLRQDPALLDYPPAGNIRGATFVAPPLRPAEPTSPVRETTAESGTTSRLPVMCRDDDLAAAERALDQAGEGHGGVLLITGEPGIGKTTLLGEIAARATARGFRVGRAGWEAEPGPVLLPWRVAVRGLLDRDDILDIPQEVRDAASESHRLAEALAGALSQGTPSLIVLDDLHWADDDSLRLTRRLAALLHSLPVVLALGSRPPAAHAPSPLTDLFASLARSGATRRQLRGLGPQAVADYIRESTDVTVTEGVAEALTARTGGNPFFVTEMVRLLSAENVLSEPDSPAWRRVPEAVGDVVRQRLDTLPSATRPILAAAAVFGRTFPAHLLAHAGLALSVSDEHREIQDIVDDALDSGLMLGLLEPGSPGQFRFSHAVVRDAVYETIPAPTRARLHAAAAGILERLYAGQWDARSAELAEHYRLAGPTHARAGWGFAVRSAEQSSRRSAHAEALRWLDIAAELQAEDPLVTALEREELLVAQARTNAMLGRTREVWPALATAGRSALDRGDPVRAAEILLTANHGAIWGWRQLGDVDLAAIRLWEDVHGALGDSHPVPRAQVELALELEKVHRVAPWADPPDAAQGVAGVAGVDVIDAALSAVRVAHSSDRELVDALLLASLALKRPDQLNRRSAVVDELVEIGARTGDEVLLTRALTSRIAVRAELGQWDDTRSDIERASELALRHHVVQELFICQTARSWFLIVEGDLDRARRLIEATEATRDTLATPGIGIDIGQQAFLARAAGLPGEAASLLEPLVPRSPGMFRDLHHLLLAESGELETVRRRVGAWHEQPPLARDYMWTSVMTFRGRLWLRLADPQAISDLRRQLEPYASRLAVFGVTAFFQGVVGHTVGELALAEGDVETGLAHLDAAREVYLRLGLTDRVAEVDARLRE